MTAAQGALNELNTVHHAKNLPTLSDMNGAADHSSWNGDLPNGGHWQLTKNGQESFSSHTS